MEEGTFSANKLAKKITLLDALHLAVRSWTSVTKKCVQNCFKKGGFLPGKIEQEDSPLNMLNISTQQVDDWIEIDEGVQTAAIPINEDIVYKFHEQNNEDDVSENESDDESEEKIPTPKEMLDALELIRKGVYHYAHDFSLQYSYENFIKNIVSSTQVQKKMTDYLKKM